MINLRRRPESHAFYTLFFMITFTLVFWLMIHEHIRNGLLGIDMGLMGPSDGLHLPAMGSDERLNPKEFHKKTKI